MKKVKFIIFFIFLVFLNFSNLYAQDNEVKDNICISEPEGEVLQISQNQAGTLLAVSFENNVILYDTSDYSKVGLLNESDSVRTVFYTENDKEYISIMTRNGSFKVIEIKKDEGGWYLNNREPYFSADCSDSTQKKSITATAFSRNSDYIATAFSDNTIQVHFLLRVTQSSITRVISEHKAMVYAMEFCPSGEYLATVSLDGNAYIWNSHSSTKVTQINGIYTRSRIPVYFTEDSVYIVSQDGRNSFRISDYAGNTLYSIMTGRAITAIRPLKDPDLIAIQNDKNEVMIYSISSRRPVSVVNIPDDSDFTVFDFNLAADYIYAGFINGEVRLFEVEPYLEDNMTLVTDSSLAGKKGAVTSVRFQEITFAAGANYLNKPYLASINFSVEYRYCNKTAPWFFGLGLTGQYGFPSSDFPTTYKIRGQVVNPPSLLSAAVFVPTGFLFSPWGNSVCIITEVRFGAKVSTLALLSGGYIIGDPVFSAFISGGAGMMVGFFEFNINCEYDSVGKLSPSAYVGVNLKWGKQK